MSQAVARIMFEESWKLVASATSTYTDDKEQSKTDRDLYSQAELKARNEKIGLWQDSKAIAPSTFRHK